jgi:hypothetical protein
MKSYVPIIHHIINSIFNALATKEKKTFIYKNQRGNPFTKSTRQKRAQVDTTRKKTKTQTNNQQK